SPGSPTGVFMVSGTHAYANEGTFTVTTTINHEGIISTTTSKATIKDDIGLLLLNPTGSMSLMATGNGIVAAQDCGVIVVNSSDATGASFVPGRAWVPGKDTAVPGGPRGPPGAAISPSPETEPPTPDPLGLPLPPAPAATFAAVHYSGSAPLTLMPGTYVGGI